ncbi:hypothetical protein NUM3379_04950 [Kineococcus sp. NUM-3379]
MSRSTVRRGLRAAAAGILAAAVAGAVAVPAGATPIRADQRYGTDRYLTSLVLEDYPLQTAFVVTGQDFPDGLTAGAVAGSMGANVYLSPRGQLTADVRQRLTYHPNIVLVGGEGVLGPDIATWLQQNTRARISRLGGQDRFETAADVARFGYPNGARHVVVATGTTYPDALAGAAAAAKLDAPVLLVTRDGVPAATSAALADLRPERITVLGSDGAVSGAVAEELAATGAQVVRVQGRDRYETSVAIARAFFDEEDTDEAVVVSGTSWPDAISAGAFAGRMGAPLLLTPRACVPQSVNLTIEALDVVRLFAVGGDAVLTEDARKRTSCGAGAKTYLDQLPWPTGNARYLSDHATIEGVFYPRSASFDTDPRNSEYRTWNLAGRYTRFTATVGVRDGNTSGLRGTIDVYGDEKLLMSRTVTAGASASFDVPVAGVHNLKVVSTSSHPTPPLQATDTVVYLGDAAVS